MDVWQNELRNFCNDTTFCNPKGRSLSSITMESEQEILGFQNYEQGELEIGEFSLLLKVKGYLASDGYTGELNISLNSLCKTICLTTPPVRFLCIRIIDTFKTLRELEELKSRVHSLNDFRNIQEQIKLTEENLSLHVQAYFQWKAGIVPSYLKEAAEVYLKNTDKKNRINIPQNTNGIPNDLTDDELLKIYRNLFSHGLIDESSSYIFIRAIRQGDHKVNWRGSIGQLSYLIKELKDRKRLAYKGIWKKVSQIFTVKGERKTKHNIESSYSKINQQSKSVINMVIRGL